MHGTTKRNNNIAAVTAGTRLFHERLDLRTPRGRRFRDLIFEHTNALGKKVTEAQRAIIRDVALLQILSEDLQQAFLETGELDHAHHGRVMNNMRRNLSALGLIGRAAKSPDDGDDVEDPLEYARRGGSRKRATLDDEEDEED